MKLEQSFEVAAPLDRVWAALIDVERVAPCLPGAEVTGRNEDGTYNGSFRVKIGPTAAAYIGTLELTEVDEGGHTATMHANGTDRRGQGGAKATVVSSVREGEAGTTVVEVVTDYSITGRLARFGRGGTIEEIGNRLLTEFAASLQAMLAGPGEYETFVGMPAVGAKDAPKGDKPARKPRKDLAAAADAVAAASEPAAPEPTAEPEPEPVAAEPAPEPEEELVPDLAVEAAADEEAEEEAAAAEEEREAAVEVAAEEELAAVMPEASLESEPPPPPPAPEPPPPPPAPEPPPPPPAPEPPPPPPAPEPPPPPAPEPPPPPPPPTAEPEPLNGLALVRTVIVDRVKSNPVPVVALLLGFLLLRRRRRRRD
jgi:uncharacterized protein